MATVVNNPQPATENNGMGFLLGAIVIIVFTMLFFAFVLPYIRSGMGTAQAPQINVPGKIDVNIKQK